MKPHEIKELRLEKKLSQQDMGDICGVSKTAVSKWEKGQTEPSGPSLIRLKELRDGKVVISELTPLESKLLADNVEAGSFKDAEHYLIESLRYLINHGSFMPLDHKLSLVAEDEAPYNPRIEEEKAKTDHGGENGTDPN